MWYESVLSQNDINLDKNAGLNTYVVLTRTPVLIQNNGMYAILQADGWDTNQAAINNPNVVGWMLSDEADGLGVPAGYTTLNNALASLPVDGRFHYNNYTKPVVDYGNGNLTASQAAQFVNAYQQVTSADYYWFTDPWSGGGTVSPECARGKVWLHRGSSMRALDAMDGQIQPIWAFVEVGWPFTETAAQGARAIQPAEIEAAAWQSIIAGARGIIYFNHSFGGPDRRSTFCAIRIMPRNAPQSQKPMH